MDEYTGVVLPETLEEVELVQAIGAPPPAAPPAEPIPTPAAPPAPTAGLVARSGACEEAPEEDKVEGKPVEAP